MSTAVSPSGEQLAGILTRKDILNRMAFRDLLVNGRADLVQGCSYDLRVGTIFHGERQIKEAESKQNSSVNEQNTPDAILKPGELVSIFTLEDLSLPADICAVAFGINSKTSRGLLVMNSGHVDPGFRGPLTVTAINMTKQDIPIRIGDPIMTIIFERLGSPTYCYEGNKARIDRERSFGDYIAFQSAHNIVDLVTHSPDSKFVTAKEVDAKSGLAIANSVQWAGLFFAVLSIVMSVISIVIAMRQ